MTKKAPVYVATLTTRSFSFTAVGRTEAEARAAMRAGWDRHRRQLSNVAPFADFEDGVSVEELRAGECSRDGSII